MRDAGGGIALRTAAWARPRADTVRRMSFVTQCQPRRAEQFVLARYRIQIVMKIRSTRT